MSDTDGDRLRQEAQKVAEKNGSNTYNKIVKDLENVIQKGKRSISLEKSSVSDSTITILRSNGLYVYHYSNKYPCACNYAESCGNHPQRMVVVSLDPSHSEIYGYNFVA